MAGAQKVLGLPYAASGAITVNRFVKITGDQTVGAVTGITDKVIGVAETSVTADEATNGKTLAVQAAPSIAWVEAAAAITRDDFVAPSANGRAQTAVSTQFVCGRAMKAAANAGDLIPVQLFVTAVALA